MWKSTHRRWQRQCPKQSWVSKFKRKGVLNPRRELCRQSKCKRRQYLGCVKTTTQKRTKYGLLQNRILTNLRRRQLSTVIMSSQSCWIVSTSVRKSSSLLNSCCPSLLIEETKVCPFWLILKRRVSKLWQMSVINGLLRKCTSSLPCQHLHSYSSVSARGLTLENTRKLSSKTLKINRRAM